MRVVWRISKASGRSAAECMRRKRKLDANHQAIGDVLQARGASVFSLAGEGKGCPDLLIGWRGRNFLIEVKRNGDYDKKAGRKRQETRTAQIAWALKWTGQYAIVTSPEDAQAFLDAQK